jgi:hypothetical protein
MSSLKEHDFPSLGGVLEVSENGTGTSGEVILFEQTPKLPLTSMAKKD